MAAGVAVLLLGLLPAGAAYPPAVSGRGGAVASAERQATAAGLDVLLAGGNAADAAVAVALALAVVHPQAGNLGGGGFAVVRFGTETVTLDFREVAPAGVHPGLYLDENGNPVPERSRVGPLAAGVPGSPAGLWELHRRFGRLPWRRVVRPALKLARDGFVVPRRLERDVTRHRELLERFPESARWLLPGGHPPRAGSTMRNPELTAVLEAYGAHGPDAIVRGPVARAVELVSRRYGGVLRAADLTAYRPVWREPVRFTLAGWRVASMPLPSSGGSILAESAAMLEPLGWAGLPRAGADRAHILAAVWKRVYADRYRLGDPESTEVGPAELLSPAWIRRRVASIDLRRAVPSGEIVPWPGSPVPEPPDTTHLSVVDADGNTVALTTTLNGTFGSGVTVPGGGFLLNNEMDDFAMAPGRPNMYGLVQGAANAVAPGRRMLSSMSPTVAWRDAEVVALGSPGGSRIPTAVLQVLLALLVDGDPLQAAVDRPRIHHQWLPDRIDAEPDALSPETAAALSDRGWTIRTTASLGEVHAVRRFADGTVEAAADPRGPGWAGVVEPGVGGRGGSVRGQATPSPPTRPSPRP